MIEICEDIAQKKLTWRYVEQNRKGDHIWWISGVDKFRSHFPNWNLTWDIHRILDQVFQQNAERWRTPDRAASSNL